MDETRWKCERCGRLLPLRPCCDHPLARTLCGGCYQAQQAGADPIKCVHKADLDIETGDPYDNGTLTPSDRWGRGVSEGDHAE